MGRRLAANLGLDRIQGADPLERLGRNRRRMRLVQLIELPPDVCPEGRFDDLPIGIQGLVTTEGIGLKNSGKGFQVRLRMFAPAVGRVGEPDRRRTRIAGRTIVPHIGHSRPVFVLPSPGASTGTGVSSTCTLAPDGAYRLSAWTRGRSSALH